MDPGQQRLSCIHIPGRSAGRQARLVDEPFAPAGKLRSRLLRPRHDIRASDASMWWPTPTTENTSSRPSATDRTPELAWPAARRCTSSRENDAAQALPPLYTCP